MESEWITVRGKKSRERKREHELHSDASDMKRILLCNSVIARKDCKYGNKCMYAHNLEQQNIVPIRKRAYNIIRGYEDIDTIDAELKRALIQLTRVCDGCIHGKCPGGYNCKNGVCDEKYKICEDDLFGGNCANVLCNAIHLTNRGLIPLNTHQLPLLDELFVEFSDHPNDNESQDSVESKDIDHIRNYLEHNSDSDAECTKSIFD